MDKPLKERRKQLKMTLEDVAEIVGVGRSTVRKWENGDIENIGRSNIVKLAKALKVTPYYIMGIEEEGVGIVTPTINIPVVNSVSAGMPTYNETDVIDYISVMNTSIKNDKEYFGLIVSGDSMDLEFKDGDIVVVEKDAQVENGEIAVVAVNGYDATVKRIKRDYDKNIIMLIPESTNREHETQVYSMDDDVHIIGKVVGMNRSY